MILINNKCSKCGTTSKPRHSMCYVDDELVCVKCAIKTLKFRGLK